MPCWLVPRDAGTWDGDESDSLPEVSWTSEWSYAGELYVGVTDGALSRFRSVKRIRSTLPLSSASTFCRVT